MICIPDFHDLISSTAYKHACVEWIPLHSFNTKFVSISCFTIYLSNAWKLACWLTRGVM